MSSRTLCVSLCILLGYGLMGEPIVESATDSPTLSLPSIPARKTDAITGTTFARLTAKISGPERQRAAVNEILKGNVPSFVRLLRPITLIDTDRKVEVIVWVSPDYVAIGEDNDFLRMPLTWPSATTVARAFDCVLPTTRLVDAIWEQADIHLTPAPLPPGPKMRSSEYYLRHRALIEGERGHLAPETLIAGHKKDVVLTGLLSRRRERIAIYGWHQQSGTPIQPLSTIHGARYADYSHGVRLVWNAVSVNGESMQFLDLLADPSLAFVLSSEGPLPTAKRLMSP